MDFNEWEKKRYEGDLAYLALQLAGHVTVAAVRGMRVSAIIWDEPIEVSGQALPSPVVEKQTYWGNRPYKKEVEPLQIYGAANASDPNAPDGLPLLDAAALLKLAEEAAKRIFLCVPFEGIHYIMTGAIADGYVPGAFEEDMKYHDQLENAGQVAEVLRILHEHEEYFLLVATSLEAFWRVSMEQAHDTLHGGPANLQQHMLPPKYRKAAR